LTLSYSSCADTESLLLSLFVEDDDKLLSSLGNVAAVVQPTPLPAKTEHCFIPDYGVISSKESIGDVSYVSMEVGDTLGPPPHYISEWLRSYAGTCHG